MFKEAHQGEVRKEASEREEPRARASLKPKEKSINREQEYATAHQPRNLMEMAGRAG